MAERNAWPSCGVASRLGDDEKCREWGWARGLTGRCCVCIDRIAAGATLIVWIAASRRREYVRMQYMVRWREVGIGNPLDCNAKRSRLSREAEAVTSTTRQDSFARDSSNPKRVGGCRTQHSHPSCPVFVLSYGWRLLRHRIHLGREPEDPMQIQGDSPRHGSLGWW